MKKFLKKINASTGFKSKFPLNYMIPLYHCVSDEVLPHLKNVISYKNCRDFETDIDFISTKFEFADWDFFKENIHKKNKKPIALLTFDDGLSEFKEVVAPILLRKGIYAVNFINPAFIENKDFMFRFKASLIIEKIKEKDFEIPKSLLHFLELNNNVKSEIINKIQSINYTNQHKIKSITELLNIDLDDYRKKNKIYMNLEDLNYVQSKGFGIASHSWDHPYFHELSLDKQIQNAQKSIDFIKENHFLDECFAFPFTDFGVTEDFFNQIFENNPNLKYTFGISGLKIDSFSRNLHRIPMEKLFSAENEIDFESNYFQIKKILNKNRLTRQ